MERHNVVMIDSDEALRAYWLPILPSFTWSDYLGLYLYTR